MRVNRRLVITSFPNCFVGTSSFMVTSTFHHLVIVDPLQNVDPSIPHVSIKLSVCARTRARAFVCE